MGRHLASGVVQRDPRVANVKVLGGVFNRAVMHGVPQIVAAALEADQGMTPDDAEAALARSPPA